MSWLLRREKREKQETPSDSIVLGVQVIFKQEGEDLVITARVRTLKDLERLKKIIDEMIDELHEAQSVGAVDSGRIGKRGKALRMAKKMAR
jgi:hypothetical protein